MGVWKLDWNLTRCHLTWRLCQAHPRMTLPPRRVRVEPLLAGSRAIELSSNGYKGDQISSQQV